MSSSSEFQSRQRVKVPRAPTRRSFLVTCSSADMKKFPTRESFSNAAVYCFNEGSFKVEVCHWVCGGEHHHNTSGFHYHMAIKISSPKRWNLVKRKLQENHGIVVNFSTSHDQYYYAFRYVTKEDQEYVKSASHPPLEDMGSPQTKKCVREMRKRASMGKSGSEASATNNNNKVPRLGKFEVSQFILGENVKDPDLLYSIANRRSLDGNNDLAKFCVTQNRKSMDDLFESTRRLVSAKAPEERRGNPRIEVIREALRGECVEGCNREWIRCALEVFDRNQIHSVAFAEAVRNDLVEGRGKKRNIILLGPANCGKTFLFAPLQHMFKTFSNPSDDKYTRQEVYD